MCNFPLYHQSGCPGQPQGDVTMYPQEEKLPRQECTSPLEVLPKSACVSSNGGLSDPFPRMARHSPLRKHSLS